MKYIFKRVFVFALSAFMMFGCFGIAANAEEYASSDLAITEVVEPRVAAYQLTFYPTDSNGVTLKVVLNCREMIGNASGSYILSVASVSISNKGSYAAVGSIVNVTNVSISEGNNHQSVTINVSYQARSANEAALSWKNSSVYVSLI